MADLNATFRKPFAEQVIAWRLRLQELRPTFSSSDPNYGQHDRAFMVAGAVKVDLLQDLSKAVDRAIVEGTGFDRFKQDFRAIVEKNGWHGWTGEETAEGREWRMRTIYQTNMRTSYMAGRHAQLVDGNYKFWVYRHSGAANPRHDHLRFDGIALPPDHPFWQSHFPPNGWGCGCNVRGARNESGIRLAKGDPDKKLPADWDAIDPRTGAPSGVAKGWNTPIDPVNNMIVVMANKAKKWDAQMILDYTASLPPSVRQLFIDALQDLAIVPRDITR